MPETSKEVLEELREELVAARNIISALLVSTNRPDSPTGHQLSDVTDCARDYLENHDLD